MVTVRPDDPVNAGAAVLSLDTADLQLEEASSVADYNRYLREAEKSRAEAENARPGKPPSLAEMRIALALADQAKARLDLARYRLSQAQLKSPFDGVVVEGDLRQRVGAPLKQGEALFKIARIDTQYAEAEINERDVHEILTKTAGQVAFVAQP